MVIEQMPVNLPDKNSPVPVPQPRGDRHEIEARHHAERGEEMPQVVKPHPVQAGCLSCLQQALPERSGVFITGAALRSASALRASGSS